MPTEEAGQTPVFRPTTVRDIMPKLKEMYSTSTPETPQAPTYKPTTVLNKWCDTGRSGHQQCFKHNDYRFSFMEFRTNDKGKLVSCVATIDTRDYTMEELKRYCRHSSFASCWPDGIVKTYGLENMFEILAASVFENLGFDDMDDAEKAPISLSQTEKTQINSTKHPLHIVRQWFLTDDDSAQHCIKLNDFTFGFAEIREAAENSFSLCHAVIDLRDYTLDELVMYVSCFFNSLDEVVKVYGVRNSLQIIAECIFKEKTSSQMDYCIDFDNWNEAVEKLPKYLKMFVPKK